MLHELTIENFILIDSLTMVFDDRLNLLSGETGAGKSILIDAMGFVLGKKPDKTLIRSGQERAVVQAVFQVKPALADSLGEAYGIRPEEGLLVIQRELFSTGRSTARINGLVVTSGVLEAVGELLVDFHGQHAHQSLLHPKNHLGLLDTYIGPEAAALRQALQESVQALNALDRTMEAHGTDREALLRQLEVLRHDIAELERAQLSPGEDAALEEQFETLRHMEEIIQTLMMAGEVLNGEDSESFPVLKGLSEVTRRLGQVSPHSSDLRHFEKEFSELYHQCADLTKELARFADRLYFDEEKYRHISDRLDLINTLKRKYSADIDGLLQGLEQRCAEEERLTSALDMLAHYDQRRQALVQQYREQAERMTALRNQGAGHFVAALLKELKVLNLPHARLSFQIEPRRDPWGAGIHRDGADQVELMLSMNAGEPMRPLKAVASGGELSRLMLALKIVQSGGDAVNTLVFDEIDSGISGKTAAVVGEKLVEVSASHQVLCISHLAQICALGDRHFLIEKQAEDQQTTTRVLLLDKEGRKREVARIVGGAHLTETGIRAAEELLQVGETLRLRRDT